MLESEAEPIEGRHSYRRNGGTNRFGRRKLSKHEIGAAITRRTHSYYYSRDTSEGKTLVQGKKTSSSHKAKKEKEKHKHHCSLPETHSQSFYSNSSHEFGRLLLLSGWCRCWFITRLQRLCRFCRGRRLRRCVKDHRRCCALWYEWLRVWVEANTNTPRTTACWRPTFCRMGEHAIGACTIDSKFAGDHASRFRWMCESATWPSTVRSELAGHRGAMMLHCRCWCSRWRSWNEQVSKGSEVWECRFRRTSCRTRMAQLAILILAKPSFRASFRRQYNARLLSRRGGWVRVPAQRVCTVNTKLAKSR